jgi:hypothetical protein
LRPPIKADINDTAHRILYDHPIIIMAFIAYFWMLSEISPRARVLVEGRNGFTGEIEAPSFLSGAQQASVEEARESAGSHKRTLPIRQLPTSEVEPIEIMTELLFDSA